MGKVQKGGTNNDSDWRLNELARDDWIARAQRMSLAMNWLAMTGLPMRKECHWRDLENVSSRSGETRGTGNTCLRVLVGDVSLEMCLSEL